MGKSTGPGTQGCEDFSSIFEGPSAGFSLGGRGGSHTTMLAPREDLCSGLSLDPDTVLPSPWQSRDKQMLTQRNSQAMAVPRLVWLNPNNLISRCDDSQCTDEEAEAKWSARCSDRGNVQTQVLLPQHPNA